MKQVPIVNVSYSISYGEVRYKPATEAEEARPKLSVQRISETTTALWTLVSRGLLIGSIVAVIVVTVAEVRRDPVVIEEIGLPEKLIEMGYAGTVAAHRLWDSAVWINDSASTTKERASFIADSRQLQITEPGTGVSLNGLAQVVRRLLNIEQSRIAGEFVCRDVGCNLEAMELRIRAFHDGTMEMVGVGRLGSIETESDIDAYFDRAALALLRMVDPYVVASFLYNVEVREQPRQTIDRSRTLVASLPPIEANDQTLHSVTEAQRIIDARHPQRAWAALLLGVWQEALGNAEPALDWYSKSILWVQQDKIGEFPNAYNGWGNSLLSLGHPEEAIEKYREAVRIDPDHTFAYNGWGNALANLGLPEEAIEKYREAVRIDPDHTLAYNGWGNALGDLGLHEEAIEKFREALRIDPDYALAYNGWGNALGDLGLHEEAIEKYREAVSIDPDFAGAYNNWGNRLGILRRHEEAIEKYREAARIDPNDAIPINGWGNRLRDLGRNKEAIERYEAALKTDPAYEIAFSNWAIVLERYLGESEKDRCRRLALELPRLMAFASSPDWAVLTDRFDEPQEACTHGIAGRP